MKYSMNLRFLMGEMGVILAVSRSRTGAKTAAEFYSRLSNELSFDYAYDSPSLSAFLLDAPWLMKCRNDVTDIQTYINSA